MTSLSSPTSSTDSTLKNFNMSDQDMILAQQLESAKTANSNLAAQMEFLKKKYQGIQDELQDVLNTQTKFEKQYYNLEAELEKSKEREEEALRKARELEFKLNSESKVAEIEKTKLLTREEQLKSKLKALQTQSQLRASPAATPPTRVARARSVSVNFSPPSFVSSLPDELEFEDNTEASLIHEAKLANRTVRQQIKEIGELKANIRQLNDRVSALTSQEIAQSNQIKQLNHQIEQLTLTNASYLEEIESYQYLLEDRTLKGQFSLGHRGSSNSLAGQAKSLGSFNLSSEITQGQSDSQSVSQITLSDQKPGKKSKDELQMLKDENKALALYISKILGKIMSNPVLAEAITANCDSRQEDETADPREIKQKKSSQLDLVPSGSSVQSDDQNSSRLSSFLPTTKPSPAPFENKVSFAISPNARSSNNSSNKSTENLLNNTNPPAFRGRSKSLLVHKHSSTRDSLADSENREASLASVFSFRNAFKKVTSPWKTSTKDNSSTVLASSPTGQH